MDLIATLTESNSVLELGELAPTIFATATELTVTLATEAELISAGAFDSNFGFLNGGPIGQLYAYGSTAFGVGAFFVGETIRLSGTNQALNTPPTSISFAAQSSAPVPEPLTILGAGAAVAFGGFFKRRLALNNRKG